uniref:Putative secreted protein n=1 Tax=Anopheles darlingi TaxID=43151 RepID=A0A2M4DLJ3_ANODA
MICLTVAGSSGTWFLQLLQTHGSQAQASRYTNRDGAGHAGVERRAPSLPTPPLLYCATGQLLQPWLALGWSRGVCVAP